MQKASVTTLRQQSLFAQCTANSFTEVSPSRLSVGFIYKWAHRRADDSFHPCDEQITVQKKWIQLPSWALILCHWNKAILLRFRSRAHFFHFGCQWDTHGEVCPDLIEVEFAGRVWRSGNWQNTMGSTAVQVQGWSCQLTICTILNTVHPSFTVLTPRRNKNCCIVSYWERYICSWLYSCTMGPLYGPGPSSNPLPNTHTLPLSLPHQPLSHFHLSSLGG